MAVTQDDQTIGIANGRVAINVRKSDGMLLSIRPVQGHNMLATGKTSLCWLEVLPPEAEKPIVLDVQSATQVRVRATGDGNVRQLEITYELAEGSVRAEVALSAMPRRAGGWRST